MIFDLVILEENMPELYGTDMQIKIRSDERTKSIPMVVFTSSIENLDVRRNYGNDVNTHIIKPVEFLFLSTAISESENIDLT